MKHKTIKIILALAAMAALSACGKKGGGGGGGCGETCPIKRHVPTSSTRLAKPYPQK